MVIKVLKEIGIDITENRSKNIAEFINSKFDYIATLCDTAKENCPFVPGGKKYIHQNFEDPSTLKGTEDEIIESVRRIRDDIKNWVDNTFGKKPNNTAGAC